MRRGRVPSGAAAGVLLYDPLVPLLTKWVRTEGRRGRRRGAADVSGVRPECRREVVDRAEASRKMGVTLRLQGVLSFLRVGARATRVAPGDIHATPPVPRPGSSRPVSPY